MGKKIKIVILILTDTLRLDHVGFYNKISQAASMTPNIDNLAKESVFFNNAYATITKTDPSISAIMTGKYPISSGLINHGRNISKDEEYNISKTISLAQLLKKNGYETLAIDWLSRWHKKGFEYYSGKLIKNLSSLHLVLDKLPIFFYLRVVDKLAIKLFKRDFLLRAYFSLYPNAKIPYDPCKYVIDKAIDILQKRNKDNFFLYLHLWDAHQPHIYARGIKSFLFDTSKKTYAKQVKELDKELGRLIEYLKEKKLYSDSIIILSSDHGENFSDHDRPFNHEGLYDDVIKIPLIIKGPFPPKIINEKVQHIDILPTIADYLKIKTETIVDGLSLSPLIKGIKQKYNRLVYFEDLIFRRFKLTNKTIRRRGIIYNKKKYIQYLYGSTQSIYNLLPKEDTEVTKEEVYHLMGEKLMEIPAMSNKGINDKYKKLLENFVNHLARKRLIADNKELNKKISKTEKVISKAFKKYPKNHIAIAWKGGKDTTVMMHIIKNMYKGKVPFKIFFNDTTLEFKETYQFIEKMKKLWNLNLIVLKHDDQELKAYHKEKDKTKKAELARIMKINSIKRAVKKYKLKGFMLGIRRDENPARKNEKYFSKREDHIRIHPLLDWTEEDIWEYIENFGVPYNSLYDKGYRSVGESPFTTKSTLSERSGRDKRKEQLMSRFRKMGYW